jgi:hypothetical protein
VRQFLQIRHGQQFPETLPPLASGLVEIDAGCDDVQDAGFTISDHVGSGNRSAVFTASLLYTVSCVD